MSLLLVCDDEITGLNEQYLGQDSPTDVLAFAQREGKFGAMNPDVLGDVVVSLDTACRQAREMGHTADDEVMLLILHGILHLLSHDHAEEGQAAVMTGLQKDIWSKLAAAGLVSEGAALRP